MRFPLPCTEDPDKRNREGETGIAGTGFAGKENKFRIETAIPHEGEVNKARYMPQQSNVIATTTPSGEVHIFDYFKHPSKPGQRDKAKPELVLVGHTKEGYGLCWNYQKRGHVLSGSNDGRVCLWDVESATQANSSLEPLMSWEAHAGAAEDVAWHRLHPELFGTVGDDCKLHIWDCRNSNRKPQITVAAHSKDVLSLDFNPFNEYLLATSSADNTTALWDLRNLSVKQHSLEQHKDEVLVVSWAPFNESILATASNDRRVAVWDLARVGQTQGIEDAKEGPPELLFVHGGHTSKIVDISWNLQEEFALASVSDDNDIHIWQLVLLLSLP